MKSQEAAPTNQPTNPKDKLQHAVGQIAARELSGRDISISYKRHGSGSDLRGTISNETTRRIHGLPPIAFEIVDVALCGTTTQRGGYQKLKALGAKYPGATIIVNHLDRVFRRREDAWDFHKFIIENELKLCDSQGLVTHEVLLRANTAARFKYELFVGGSS